jgi:ATP-dependent exoDNAse (exonuclease V) alpha subunit
VIGGREFRVGDAVIARRNDRQRDLDNGTRATVKAIDPRTMALIVQTDQGSPRDLDDTYVAEHLEHAYALTGHGIQGATVDWAAVVGRPADFTAEWAYTALSRARQRTELHVITESSPESHACEDFVTRDPEIVLDAAMRSLAAAMTRRDREPLATEHVYGAGADGTAASTVRPPEPNRLGQAQRRGMHIGQ